MEAWAGEITQHLRLLAAGPDNLDMFDPWKPHTVKDRTYSFLYVILSLPHQRYDTMRYGLELGTVVQVFNPSAWEAKAGGWISMSLRVSLAHIVSSRLVTATW